MKSTKLKNSCEVKKDQSFYSKEDIAMMFSVLKDNYLHKIWLKLLFAYGLTLVELVNFQVGDIDNVNKKVKIRSSRKMRHRAMPIPKCLIFELQREVAHKKPTEFLFQGRAKGGKIHTRTIQKLFEKIHQLTGIEVTIMKIRRSIAIYFLQMGWSEKEVTILLGHSHLRTTRKLVGNYPFLPKTDFPIDEILENLV